MMSQSPSGLTSSERDLQEADFRRARTCHRPSPPGSADSPIIRATAITLTLCWSPFGWSATLPADLKWESNNQDPLYADPAAKRGGTFRTFMTSFP